MSDKRKNLLIIVNALAWAGAILMVSWFTKGAVDEDTGFMITMFLFVGWFVVNGFLVPSGRTAREEIECVKRFFRIGGKKPE